MNDNKQAGCLTSECKRAKSVSDTAPVAENGPICRQVLQSRLRNADGDIDDGPGPLQVEIPQSRKDGGLYD